eukprot:10935408-Lingulodinium_polyedra.AAC.1
MARLARRSRRCPPHASQWMACRSAAAAASGLSRGTGDKAGPSNGQRQSPSSPGCARRHSPGAAGRLAAGCQSP